MRAKTVGVFLVTAMSLFGVFYWMTEEARLDADFEAQQAELIARGREYFAPDTIYFDVTVTAAGFAPAELEVPVNSTVRFTNQTGGELSVSIPDGQPEIVPVRVGTPALPGQGQGKVIRDGVVSITARGVSGSLTVTAGPETLNPTAANCSRCHGADGRGGLVGSTGVRAPDLHSRRLALLWKATGGSIAANGVPPNLSNYVNWVIRFGGIVVSNNPRSLMPAWGIEANGPLTIDQIDALTALIGSWADETLQQPVESIPPTVEAGALVYRDNCAVCHALDLSGLAGPNLQNIGAEPVTVLPNPIAHLDQLIADYNADPAAMLEKWIRDSATNYNDGLATGMLPFPESGALTPDALEALILFLLDQVQ